MNNILKARRRKKNTLKLHIQIELSTFLHLIRQTRSSSVHSDASVIIKSSNRDNN
jgi:hypothetical protein